MQCLLLFVSDLSALFCFEKKTSFFLANVHLCFIFFGLFWYLIQPFAHNIVTAAVPLRLGLHLFTGYLGRGGRGKL